MASQRTYIKPEVLKLKLDNTISLVMMSAPSDPPPFGGSTKKNDKPFQSPFGDKPFG
jgi:hypothetical protein